MLMIIFNVLLIVFGIISVDYSMNGIMKNQKNIRIISYAIINEKIIELDIMGTKFDINTMYIKRDFNKIKNKLFSN